MLLIYVYGAGAAAVALLWMSYADTNMKPETRELGWKIFVPLCMVIGAFWPLMIPYLAWEVIKRLAKSMAKQGWNG